MYLLWISDINPKAFFLLENIPTTSKMLQILILREQKLENSQISVFFIPTK